MEVSQPNLSQHLNLLKQQQIVDCYEDGKKRCYFLCCPEFIRGLFDLLENDFTARDPEKVKKIFLNKND
jgi:DNA-binding transcriptional ArsR family regulator